MCKKNLILIVFSNPNGKSVGIVILKIFWKKQINNSVISNSIIYVSL